MALSYRLDAYLTLERVMLGLEENGDLLADKVRDVLDPFWYSLTPEELAYLDNRKIGEVHLLHPVRLTSSGLFLKPTRSEGGFLEEVKGAQVGKHFDFRETLAA